jgi:hypothetical protein
MEYKQLKVFRFKLSENVIAHIKEFSRIHKLDEKDDFKDAWESWCETNNNMIENEKQQLEQNGFTGDIIDKMYKSARYYYCKKSNVTTLPKKRRKYISLNKDILLLIDRHIQNNIENNSDFKPSTGFNEFVTTILSNHENKYIDELKKNGLSIDEINNKLKKTYKNRYFVIYRAT